MITREEYVTRFADMLMMRKLGPAGLDSELESGAPLSTKIMCSVGWPDKGGAIKKERGRVLAQCWSPRLNREGRVEIFINPTLEDPVDIGASLLHELLHGSVGQAEGHGPKFEEACRRVGLSGPPEATKPSEGLIAELKAMAEELGPNPHVAMEYEYKPNAMTLVKLECGNAECPRKGYSVRVTQAALAEDGAPYCAVCDTKLVPIPDTEHDGIEEISPSYELTPEGEPRPGGGAPPPQPDYNEEWIEIEIEGGDDDVPAPAPGGNDVLTFAERVALMKLVAAGGLITGSDFRLREKVSTNIIGRLFKRGYISKYSTNPVRWEITQKGRDAA